MATVDLSNSSISYCVPGLKFVTEPTKACAPQPGQSCPPRYFLYMDLNSARCVEGSLSVKSVQPMPFCLNLLTKVTLMVSILTGSQSHMTTQKISFGRPQVLIVVRNVHVTATYMELHLLRLWAPTTSVRADSTLWDGKGCSSFDMCSRKGGPWFCKNLPEPTTDDIELCICAT